MGDPIVLSVCPVCWGSVDVEQEYYTDGDGEYWHRDCAPPDVVERYGDATHDATHSPA